MHQNIIREIAHDLLICIRHELGEPFLKHCVDVSEFKQTRSITMGIQVPFPCPVATDLAIRDSTTAYVSREIAKIILDIGQPVRFVWPVQFMTTNHQILKDPDAANLAVALIDNLGTPIAAVWVEYTPK